ncbi:hypothetical protein [Nakamurella lactea]|uniref:hypothetical protein n=1 Tax=Nakamurella lactea TaxID=459515 RepID=UPI0012B5ABE2|nr:hypothetical protein [Nakamurella lactea]
MSERSEAPKTGHPSTIRSRARQGKMRRRDAILITLGCGLSTLVLCLGVNALFGSPVQWFWLVAAAVYVVLLVGAFLLIRLTPSA